MMNRSEGDSYRPHYADLGGPPLPSTGVNEAMYHFQGNSNHRGGQRESREPNARDRPPRHFRFRAPPPSERPLMTIGHIQESSQLTFGGTDGAKDKFRNLDDLTDTDETDMDVSVDEENDENDNTPNLRPSKRTRIDEEGTAASQTPKWSNPDPYTALPPVDQDSRKKTNVVKLIRKARNTTATDQQTKSLSNEDDFISFDFMDDHEEFPAMAPLDAPSGPRLGRHEVTPAFKLGKRTRDEFETATLITPKYGQQHHSDGRVLEWWRALPDSNPTPWVCNNPDPSESAGVALHKEIIDFYEWVRPKDFEIAVRENVINRLEQALLRLHPGGQLKAFGSYAAGLYLPTGDMDLVWLERNFRPRMLPSGLPPKPNKYILQSVARFLREQRIARSGSVVPILNAKVPIIKFVENVSGLKIDLSFNNTTGVTANETFHTWREQHPAMPIITSIIKQYLMIRGLNDVASGGLGGFSVICLVTSLIQHMPLTNRSSNLGQLLVEFFNLYGNLFNREAMAIRLDPPGYLEAAQYRPFRFNHDKPDRLKIIDPNRPENNISGGSNKVGLIFDCFAQACGALQDCLSRHEQGQKIVSFLEDIVGGNFDAYETQREFLRDLHQGPVGQRAPAVVPPPPPPQVPNQNWNSQTPPPPPPSPPSSTYQSRVAVRKKSVTLPNEIRQNAPPPATRAARSKALGQAELIALDSASSDEEPVEVDQPALLRATVARLRKLRPQLNDRVNVATDMRALASIGGYNNLNAMLRDLDARQANRPIKAQETSPTDKAGLPSPDWATDSQRERARKFRPKKVAEIDRCTTQKDLAAICGFTGPTVFFVELKKWEQENQLVGKGKGQKSKLGVPAAKPQKANGAGGKRKNN